ncbi:hypothetical protein GLOTRDRAFT_137819 [Gloeophyllum trabeum ATCC 11539]|uniref:Uncharacterized protein n=1 Tax=Gloeophyllum trabeum (strain ATCC 11539 / FP-39264 / Madison 617) TaxID=670483 RepID=S7QDY6_GLOTA|nr:uncharacterized protein GLOTRDRAFT_137819 [Gloeophyllum trabeum ATCC 11539]EPQ57503.1 hypothetical protein GLOTRDRAFT_137819 [Gloeophyllum trabeum ATCC 11539]
MVVLPTTLLLFSWYTAVNAGSARKGESCSQANSRLQVGTYQFYSDCDSVTYCSNAGTCELKGCRRDEFPYGYAQDDQSIPDLCPRGQFCPDEEDACQDLLPVGSPCQLNRDDQCEAPPNFVELRDESGRGLNHNGSVCLNNICMWANVTVGQQCVVENTAYIAYGANGQEFIDVVSRGNCKLGSYCDSQQLVCMQTKQLNEACNADKECESYNCLPSGKCGKPADASHHYAIWVYIIVCICIFGGMIGTLTGLFFMHGKQREQEREKRIQYWREQNAFRQNIIQLRETTRNSFLSYPNESPRNTVYSRDGSSEGDSQMPMLHANKPGSNLRHGYSDDGLDDDEGISMKPREQAGF